MGGTELALLAGAGCAAGFVAGLLGVGGGIVFTPVLLLAFRQAGVPMALVPALTIGTGLLCTGLAAGSSAFHHYRKGAVVGRMALTVGASSAAVVFATTRWVTTRPWYDAALFQGLFAVLLLAVGVRMLRGVRPEADPGERQRGWGALVATGTAAGAVATAAGVGGGVVLVPAYQRLLGLPIHRAVGTSSATIVLIAATGVVSYAVAGWGVEERAWAVGYVDGARALALALPAVVTARLGVRVAHHVATRPLRRLFAGLALVVAVRMLWGVLG